MMSTEVELELSANWRVSKVHGADKNPGDSQYKAYYCLKWGEEIIDHKEYTRVELEQEISRLHQAGEDATDHERALMQFASRS